MAKIFFLLLLIALIVWLVKWMRKSPKFDKFCKDIETGYTEAPSTTESIKTIDKDMDGLKKKADNNKREVEQINKDTDKITEYLGDKDGKKGDSKK
ncbi:MAG: hypothetical protein DRO67_02710 [Candidatus Asgardarchaeum californiense]|nr:MAG: hypothetical protein DRO67_02710 [Candidatus Asgardarchaeum californiense]